MGAAIEKARNEWARASWAANRFQHARGDEDDPGAADRRRAARPPSSCVRGRSGRVARGYARGAAAWTRGWRSASPSSSSMRSRWRTRTGVLHGALSPTNVVVTPRGTVRLLDFATTPGLLARRSGVSEALARVSRPSWPPSSARIASNRPRGPPPHRPSSPTSGRCGACLYFALAGEGAPLRRARALRRASPARIRVAVPSWIARSRSTRSSATRARTRCSATSAASGRGRKPQASDGGDVPLPSGTETDGGASRCRPS